MKITILGKVEIEVDEEKFMGGTPEEMLKNGSLVVGAIEVSIVDEDGDNIIEGEDIQDEVRSRIMEQLLK